MGKTDSGGSRSYVTGGSEVASPVLSDGSAVYTPGEGERRSGATKTYHTDALGSVRGTTSAAQSATDATLYDAFGLVVSRTGSTPTPFGFAGDWQYQGDADSGLMLLGHRYYDPSTGRFLSQDPVGDGDNWYAYCDNEPLGWVDPEGLDKLKLPLDPKGLPKGWTPIPHGHPDGGTRWRGPSGEDGLEFHPGKPGKRGGHWHPLRPKPGKPGKPDKPGKPGGWGKGKAHLKPGTEVDIKPGPRTAVDPIVRSRPEGRSWWPVRLRGIRLPSLPAFGINTGGLAPSLPIFVVPKAIFVWPNMERDAC